MFTTTYAGKSFLVTYRPFSDSDATSTKVMLGMDEEEVRRHFGLRYYGEIVKIEEQPIP